MWSALFAIKLMMLMMGQGGARAVRTQTIGGTMIVCHYITGHFFRKMKIGYAPGARAYWNDSVGPAFKLNIQTLYLRIGSHVQEVVKRSTIQDVCLHRFCAIMNCQLNGCAQFVSTSSKSYRAKWYSTMGQIGQSGEGLTVILDTCTLYSDIESVINMW